MKIISTFLLLFLVFHTSYGQQAEIEKLKREAFIAPNDTNKIEVLLAISEYYYFSNPDSTLKFSLEALDLSQKLEHPLAKLYSFNRVGEAYRHMGDYPNSLKMQFQALQIAKKLKYKAGEAASLGFIGITYIEFREFKLALICLSQAYQINSTLLTRRVPATFDLSNIGETYNLLKMQDSALYYQQWAYRNYEAMKSSPLPLKSLILSRLGKIYFELKKNDSALLLYRSALANSKMINDRLNESKIKKKLAELFESEGKYDSSLYYARMALKVGQTVAQKMEVYEVSNLLSKLFRKTNYPDSSYYYADIAIAMKDSVYGPEKVKQLQAVMLKEQEDQQLLIKEKEQQSIRIKFIFLLVILGVLLSIGYVLYRNNRLKQKANTILNQEKTKVENTLQQLKEAQSQLIQSAKMASLGELTAGIAHEIQNPLNFVNNFSEISKELLDEMKTALDNGDAEDAKEIAEDIIQNLEKINHHGKRADAIVKGMLQHSRASSGKKEPTDINALADEYLRLSYHGLRAKDKSFNATIKTDFDASREKINVIPQDIGRVILNLLTNAFYAVNEKKKQQPDGYEPIVSVSTKKVSDKVEVKVADNGNGIPQKVLDKIFQPFFTTKPTGQGTGLGLSLSYDIVKAHGGEIKVETSEGEGTGFIIKLPIMPI
jgi:signal transduction histidine kinase